MPIPGVIAVDVAVLLPPVAVRTVTRLNARLWPPPDGFRFDSSHLPHLTLVQQFVRADDLAAVCKNVGNVLRDTPPLALRGVTLRPGRTVTVLAIDRTPQLDDLHTRLIDRLAPHAAPSADASAFVADGEPARDDDVAGVAHFATNAARRRFDPHVTLGVGTMDGPWSPVTCLATEIAVCHLGRFCTCRRVLGTWTLTADAS